MNISYKRTGGFANIPLTVHLDTDKLSTEEVEKLTSMLDAALKLNVKPSKEVMDGHHYELTMEDKDNTKKIEVNDGAMTDQLDELFTSILKLARK